MTRRFELDHPDVAHLLALQDGVVSRQQLLRAAAQPHDIARLRRRRELVTADNGIYLTHTGSLTRRQREWLAVLTAWPAALAGPSALPGARGRTVHIVVAPGRKVVTPPWVRVRRMTAGETVDWGAVPPRVRLEHATIDVMSALVTDGDIAAAFATLADVTHTRLTTPQRIRTVLDARARVGGRRVVAALLADASHGACSVLERGYLHRIERAHGLPRGHRQRISTATGRVTAQDVRYEEYGVVVELDGRAYHDTPASWDADARRDLAELATTGAVTARVTHGLVFGDACRTARWIAEILHQRGWAEEPRCCPDCA